MSNLSRRQLQVHRQELAETEYARLLDIFHAVDKLQSSDDVLMRRFFKRDHQLDFTFIDLVGPNGKNRVKVQIVDLLQQLPKHLMACLLYEQPRPLPPRGKRPKLHVLNTTLTDTSLGMESQIDYVSKGLKVLFYLTWAASRDDDPTIRLSEAEMTILTDSTFQDSVLDLIALTLTTVAGPLRETCVAGAAAGDAAAAARVLEVASLVPVACNVLVGVLNVHGEDPSAEYPYDGVVELLLKNRHAPIVLAGVFDAIRVVLDAVRSALLSRSKVVDFEALCYQAGAAMETVGWLAEHPLFHHAMLKADSGAEALLRLVAGGINLGDKHAEPAIRVAMLQVGPLPADAVTTGPTAGGAELLIARSLLLMTAALMEGPDVCAQPLAAAVPNSATSTAMCHQFAVTAFVTAADFMLLSACSKPNPLAQIRGGGPQLVINAMRASCTVLSTPELLKAGDNRVGKLGGPLLLGVTSCLCIGEKAFTARWCFGMEAYHMFLRSDQYVLSSKRGAFRARLARLSTALEQPGFRALLPSHNPVAPEEGGGQAEYAMLAAVELCLLFTAILVQVDRLAATPGTAPGGALAGLARARLGGVAAGADAALEAMQANLKTLRSFVLGFECDVLDADTRAHLRDMDLTRPM